MANGDALRRPGVAKYQDVADALDALPAGGGGGAQISAGSQLGATSGTILFQNSNGFTFGMSNSSVITGSYTVPTVTNSSWTVSDNATSGTVGRLAFTNLNGVTLSLSSGTGGLHTIVGSHNALTSQSGQAFSASGGSSAFQTLNFVNGNGLTFTNNAGSVGASYTVPTVTNSSWTVSDNATSGSVGRLAFTNLNGVTLSLSSGTGGLHTIVGSHNALTSQSNQAFSAAGGSSAFQTLSFGDRLGFSWTNTAGSVALASLNLSLYAASNTTQGTSGTQNHSALSFAGAGAVSVGVTNGSVLISGQNSTVNQTGPNIAAGTQTATSGTVVFSNSNNITFGMSGSTQVTASFDPKFATLSFYQNIPAGWLQASAITQTSGSSIFVQPFDVPAAVSFSYIRMLASWNDSAVGTAGTTANNSTYSCERYTTFAIVIYSQGVGASSRSIQSYLSTSAGLTGRTQYGGGTAGSSYTMTLAKTYPAGVITNNQWTTSYAGNSASIVVSSNSNTLFTGMRFLDIQWGSSLSPGNYWLGIGASTSSASQSANISFVGTAAMPISVVGNSQSNLSVGIIGSVTSASDFGLRPAAGLWTTNSSIISTGSIGMNSVSQVVSNPQVVFQLLRFN